ncbi:MAG: ABC transporter substrate-binding protein [Planctomycetota bacterium]
MAFARAFVLAAAAVLSAGCGKAAPAPGGPVRITLWHTQTLRVAASLEDAVAAFHRVEPGVRIELVYGGDYTQLFQKVRSGLEGGKPPDMAVAYESMAIEYFDRGALRSLDDLVSDPTDGLTPADRADFFPGLLERGRLPSAGGKMLTFPFTKSVLVLYANLDLLKASGFDTPPRTWEELLRQGEAISKARGRPCFPFSGDASTLHGMLLACGGGIANGDESRALYDTPAGRKAFGILRALKEKGVLFRVTPKTEEDIQAFARGAAAFIVRSSVARGNLEEAIRDRPAWTIAAFPSAEGCPGATILYGGNLCIFKSTPSREKAAWKFLKFFSSTAQTAAWSERTGYLPVRASALREAAYEKFLEAHPRNRVPVDSLAFARPEPSAKGWQAVRGRLEDAVARLLGGGDPVEAILSDLQREADRALAKARGVVAP